MAFFVSLSLCGKKALFGVGSIIITVNITGYTVWNIEKRQIDTL
jgi:hypothetical protein